MVRWLNFYRNSPSDTASPVYTLNTKIWPYAAVRTINMSNPSTTGVIVKVWIVPNGGGPDDSNAVIPGWYLPPKNATTGDASVSQWTGFEVMTTNGDSIWVEASVSGVVAVSINGGGSK